MGFYTEPDLGDEMAQRADWRGFVSGRPGYSESLGGQPAVFPVHNTAIRPRCCTLIFLINYVKAIFRLSAAKILGRFHGIGANIIAALLGTVTPFVPARPSPLFIGFTSAGLPLGVTFSFLISSPMVDLGSLVLLMSIFGACRHYLCAAWAGHRGDRRYHHEKLHMERHVESFILTAGKVDIESPDLTRRDRMIYAKEQTAATFKKVFPYILIGVGIGAVIHNWIPEDWIAAVLGSRNPFGVVLATLIGVPMYGDIFGTIPIAEALLAKGALLGSILSFMMAVTTLSLPSMIMLRKAVKPRLLALFIAICSVIIIVGYFFNFIQGYIL